MNKLLCFFEVEIFAQCEIRNAVVNILAVTKDEDGVIICCHRVCVALSFMDGIALRLPWTRLNRMTSALLLTTFYFTGQVDHAWYKVNQIRKFMAVLCCLLEILNLKLGHLVGKQDRTLAWSPRGRWDWLTRPHNQVVLNNAYFVSARIWFQ